MLGIAGALAGSPTSSSKGRGSETKSISGVTHDDEQRPVKKVPRVPHLECTVRLHRFYDALTILMRNEDADERTEIGHGEIDRLVMASFTKDAVQTMETLDGKQHHYTRDTFARFYSNRLRVGSVQFAVAAVHDERRLSNGNVIVPSDLSIHIKSRCGVEYVLAKTQETEFDAATLKIRRQLTRHAGTKPIIDSAGIAAVAKGYAAELGGYESKERLLKTLITERYECALRTIEHCD